MTIRCGIDIGHCTTKAVVHDSETKLWHFLSTADMPEQDFVDRLRDLGVQHLDIIGSGKDNLKFEHKAKRFVGKDEAMAKVWGADFILNNHFMDSWGDIKHLNEFLLIDVGTGIHYTKGNILLCEAEQYPYPNGLGGGFLAGIAVNTSGLVAHTKSDRLIAAVDRLALEHMEKYPSDSPDVLNKDLDNSLQDYIVRQEIVSSCAKLNNGSHIRTVCFGLLNMMANQIVRDVRMMCWEKGLPTTIIATGTLIVKMQSFSRLLKQYLARFGYDLFVPNYAEFIGALGVMEMVNPSVCKETRDLLDERAKQADAGETKMLSSEEVHKTLMERAHTNALAQPNNTILRD